MQWKLLIAVGGLSDANGSMELWDTSNNIIREIEYVNGTMDTSQVSKVHISHCSKMKRNGKKLSRFQFHFLGLLWTSLISKQETNFSRSKIGTGLVFCHSFSFSNNVIYMTKSSNSTWREMFWGYFSRNENMQADHNLNVLYLHTLYYLLREQDHFTIAPPWSYFSCNRNIFAPPCTFFSCNKWKSSAHPVCLIDTKFTVKFKIFVIVMFFNHSRVWNLGHLQGILRLPLR